VDNFLRGYFGSAATLAQLATDQLINPERMDRPINKSWMLSNYMYDPIGSRNVNEFYELRDKVAPVQNTLREIMKTDPDRAERYALDNEQKLLLATTVTNTLATLSQIRAYRKYLASDLAAKELSQEERRAATDEARTYEQELTGWLREAKNSVN
jgi:hypothetical protein